MLVPIVQHVPEWLKKRQPWYIATFNIFNYTLTILAALAVNRWVLERRRPALERATLRIAIAGLAACIVYVLVNHGAARGDVPPRPRHLGPRVGSVHRRVDLGRARARRARRRHRDASGSSNPWLIPLALAPLVLINRSLSVPALQMEARVDPKTGLFNARHFAAALVGRADARASGSTGRCR